MDDARRGRVGAGRALHLLLLLALLVCAHPALACKRGDLPCWCLKAGGRWETPPQPLLPTCKVSFQVQGKQRTANVYLPANYEPSDSAPMWIHLHGVFWRSMGDIGSQVKGWPVQAADASALWDKLANGKPHQEGAIIVYPQSLGDPNTRQFFNNGYWTCSVGVCIDKHTDDIAFLEQLVSSLPGRFSADPKRVYLSGKSAGGILVHAALCRSKVVADKVAVAIDVIGGIPDAMAKACTPKGRTNVLLVHGMKDEHLPWASSVVLDYVPFMSTQAAAGFWRDKYGLHRSTRKDYRGGEYKCEYFSGSGKANVAICGITDAGHTCDIPYVGAPYDLAWSYVKGIKS